MTNQKAYCACCLKYRPVRVKITKEQMKIIGTFPFEIKQKIAGEFLLILKVGICNTCYCRLYWRRMKSKSDKNVG